MEEVKMTERECLENSLKQWIYVFDNVGYKDNAKHTYFAIHGLPTVKNHCYMCEFASKECGMFHMCNFCPLNGYAWENKEGEFFGCENDDSSPYKLWNESTNFELIREGAQEMIDAIKTALSELKD